MGRWHTHDLSRLRNSVPILDILAHYGLQGGLRPARDDDLVGACPLPDHGGDRSNRGAFQVRLGCNRWICYTHCGGGDTVELVARMEGGSYSRAASVLAGLEHDHPPWHERPATTRPAFIPYLRELTLAPCHPFLLDKGIRPATAHHFDCGFWAHDGFLSGCIGVRLHDVEGRPLGYAGRRLEPSEITAWGKWKLPRGTPKHALLYNWHRAEPHSIESPLVVVEGPFDAMRVHQAGFPAVVALMGTHTSTCQLALIRKASRIVLLMDGDRAGRDATRRIAMSMPLSHIDPIFLPDDIGPPDLAEDKLTTLLSCTLNRP
jgi:hypothetical protein